MLINMKFNAQVSFKDLLLAGMIMETPGQHLHQEDAPVQDTWRTLVIGILQLMNKQNLLDAQN